MFSLLLFNLIYFQKFFSELFNYYTIPLKNVTPTDKKLSL